MEKRVNRKNNFKHFAAMNLNKDKGKVVPVLFY
jgi:hypothetical protein